MDDRRCSSRAADTQKRQPRGQISARAKILYGQLHLYNPPLIPKYSLTESDPYWEISWAADIYDDCMR